MNKKELELLIEQIPRYIKTMSPDRIISLCEIYLDRGLVTHYYDYVFEYHFFMMFWRELEQFDLSQFVKILQFLKKLNYPKEDQEYFIEEMPFEIEEKLAKENDVDTVKALLHEFEDLQAFDIDYYQIEETIKLLKKKVYFLSNNYLRVRDSQFINIIRDDIQKLGEKKNKNKNS